MTEVIYAYDYVLYTTPSPCLPRSYYAGTASILFLLRCH